MTSSVRPAAQDLDRGRRPRRPPSPLADWPLAGPLPALEPLPPHELRGLLRCDDVDGDRAELALARLARGQGALELAIGERLAALRLGDRLPRLGFSCIGDYARERLGLQERTAEALAHLAEGLRDRPLLGAAVRSGEVRLRHAQTVLPVARGPAEAGWVERAHLQTVWWGARLDRLPLRSVHDGWLTVTGHAPDGLDWRLGGRPFGRDFR